MQGNEDKVSEAFSRQGPVFDSLDEGNLLSRHLRRIFRAEVERHLLPGSRILELNCGTGIDALYFAAQGHSILATDNAPGMISALERKAGEQGLGKRVQARRLSYHHLDQLNGERFDHIVSNFGGLNCTHDLAAVLAQMPALLKPGGKITLVIMPRVCPWELVMALKGKFHTAFRRFGRPAPANVEGVTFYCHYYNPSYVIRNLRKAFRLISLKGIYITVPPEFYRNFVERYPRTYRILSTVDRVISPIFPFNRWCDHYMITMQKRD